MYASFVFSRRLPSLQERACERLANPWSTSRAHPHSWPFLANTTGQDGSNGVSELLRFLVDSALEKDGELLLEGKVEGLSREVTDNVSHVASPQSLDSLFLDDLAETIADSVIAALGDQCGIDVLGLEEELHSLDGRDERLGDGGTDAAHQEVD